MITLLVFGILVGLDNLQVASALGLMGVKQDRRWLLVSAFAFFEMLMPLLGLLIGSKINEHFRQMAEWLGPCLMVVLGLYILIRELTEKKETEFVNSKWLLISLPFLMSLDNLFAGIGLGTTGYPIWSTAAVVGLCAGSMCFAGLFIGKSIRSALPGKVEIISAIYLIGLGIFWAMKD